METGHRQYNYNEITCQIVLPYCVRVPEEEYQFNNKDVNVSLTFRRHERISNDDHFEPGRNDGQRGVLLGSDQANNLKYRNKLTEITPIYGLRATFLPAKRNF